MKVYRITKAQYSGDLSGKGAELYAGRWNSQGNKMVYTSGSAALALLETLAWTPMSTLLAAGFVLMVIECPDTSMGEVSTSALSEGWNRLHGYPATQKLGDNWLIRGDTLLFRVPSAILTMESNFLLNPAHLLMSEVKIVEIFDLQLDHRVVKSLA